MSKVTVICYGQREEWESREKAAVFYLDCMNNSWGSERERYTDIYIGLVMGKSICTDGQPERKH